MAEEINNVNEIDLMMAILCAVQPRGDCMTHREIARICGCSPSLIYLNDRRGRRKMANLILFQTKNEEIRL